MEVGYFMMPIHDVAKEYHKTLEEDMESIIYADQLGFSEAWVGEHYSSGAEQITSPLIFHANLIARTKNIKLATGVICLPQYHPALTAGQCAMFDHLSNGRFIMGVGPGGLPSDFELFGTMESDRNSMMQEAIEQIKELWSTDPPYNIKGKHWSYGVNDWFNERLELGYVAKPLQQPHPPMAISGMSPSSSSMKYAGTQNFIPVSANFVGHWVAKTHWPKYVEGAKEAGHVANPEIWHVAKSIYVDETDQKAEAVVNDSNGPFSYYYEYLHTLFEKADMMGGFVVNKDDSTENYKFQDMRDGLVFRGSPQTVAKQILELREEIGHFGTLLYTAHDWVDKIKMKNSMRLMAEEVMPIVNAAIRNEISSAAE
jgi:alkanesulfonate monooxygenase SsuD/methylene tetrahydromethanopterin reductase-like flavin-dependent oxidoreductase (luciferase family)